MINSFEIAGKIFDFWKKEKRFLPKAPSLYGMTLLNIPTKSAILR